MISKPKNWENVQAFTDRPKLPVGGYVCKIKKAVVQDTDYGKQLCILFDIAEGEYAGFYADDFKNNQREDKKWKGVLRQWLPKDDGSEKDEWTKSSFKGFVTSVENSNQGYQWNWDENSLAGKEIGIIFRNEEWEYNGKTGWIVKPFRATSVDTIQEGSYTVPEDKPLKNKASDNTEAGYFTEIKDDDGELPF